MQQLCCGEAGCYAVRTSARRLYQKLNQFSSYMQCMQPADASRTEYCALHQMLSRLAKCSPDRSILENDVDDFSITPSSANYFTRPHHPSAQNMLRRLRCGASHKQRYSTRLIQLSQNCLRLDTSSPHARFDAFNGAAHLLARATCSVDFYVVTI